MESDLAKWENMLGLAESGCELVVEDVKQCVSLPLSFPAYILNLIHYLLPSHFLSSYFLTPPPLPSLCHAAGFKPGVLAVFRGQNTCFEMLTKEIVIGRGSMGGEKVNIDLMREVPNGKVSRKQVCTYVGFPLCVYMRVIFV